MQGLGLATIGYQTATLSAVTSTLREAGIELLVDVRAVAASRRPGFAKSALAAGLAGVGIEYLHLRGLGTPAAGREAARRGRHAVMQGIFTTHLATADAQAELVTLAGLVRRRRVCLLCFERDPEHCHRSLVAAELQGAMPITVHHLEPPPIR